MSSPDRVESDQPRPAIPGFVGGTKAACRDRGEAHQGMGVGVAWLVVVDGAFHAMPAHHELFFQKALNERDVTTKRLAGRENQDHFAGQACVCAREVLFKGIPKDPGIA